MRAFICFFLLAISFQETTEDEERASEIIASRLRQLKDELLVLDVYCKGSSQRDIRLLRETARELDSPRAHVSDKLSLYSSRAGLFGSAMMLAGLIPNPLSPALLSYGSYLTASSVVGHVGNVFIGEESYDFTKVAHVLERVNKFYEVMLRLEDAHAALLELDPEAILRDKNDKPTLQSMGAMKTAFVGFSSLISIVTESKNIAEVSRKIQNREEWIRLLRDVAYDMQKVCDGSPYCVT